MTIASYAYNLMWIAPKLTQPGDSQRGVFCQPMPGPTAENILAIASSNPTVHVHLWVDRLRLTGDELLWFRDAFLGRSSDNLFVRDLRSIERYDKTKLFNLSDHSPNWRQNNESLIWRQVDTARLLVALEGNYDQVFYSDADLVNLNIRSDDVQRALSRHGVIFTGSVINGNPWFENGMFGFHKSRKSFFWQLYMQTLMDVTNNDVNGYETYTRYIRQLIKDERINPEEILFSAGTMVLRRTTLNIPSPKREAAPTRLILPRIGSLHRPF